MTIHAARPIRRRALEAVLAFALMASGCACDRKPAAHAACTPEDDAALCARVRAECGEIEAVDGCGIARTARCGDCPAGVACGVPGGPNRCAACRSESDAAFCGRSGFECGPATGVDTCGATRDVDCGRCAGDLTCGADHRCAFTCRPPSDGELCATWGAACGSAQLTDRCGSVRRVECGACPVGERCDELNLCRHCFPEPDAAVCARLGDACGTLIAADQCGNARTVACGGCPTGLVCGVVEANRCDYQWCEADGWCWVNPMPQGNDLWATWASASDDVWAVGDVGTVMRWDGSRWERSDPGTKANLRAVWGFSSNDVWVAGEQVILHWDGASWHQVASPIQGSWRTIWGATPRDLWLVSAPDRNQYWDVVRPAQAVRWDGSALRVTALPAEPVAIWGTAANDVWLATAVSPSADRLFRFDGSTWTAAPTAFSEVIAGWSTSATDVWACACSGPNCGPAHWDGSAWSEIAGDPCTAIWGSATAAFAVTTNSVSAWNGSSWTPGERNQHWPSAVFGTSTQDVWSVGRDGEVSRWDGAAFAPMVRRPLGEAVDSLWGAREDDLWTSGAALRHFDGARWAEVAIVGEDGQPIPAWNLVGYGTGQLWAFGYGKEVLRRSVAGVWDVALPGEGGWPSSRASLAGAWDGGVWLIGASPGDTMEPIGPWFFFRWNGGGFEATQYPRALARAIASVDASDAWAAGDLGSVEHWDGQCWSDYSVALDSTLTGVVASATEVWVGGAGDVGSAGLPSGVFYRWTGSQWIAAPGEFPAVHGMCGTPDEFWAVGEGMVHHRRGSWTVAPVRAPALAGCWVSPVGDVWAWGHGDGTVLRRSR